MFEDGKVLEYLVRTAFPTVEHSRSNVLIEGVRVISYDIETDPLSGPIGAMASVVRPGQEIQKTGPIRLMLRTFMMPADIGTDQYLAVCNASVLEETPADVAAMSAFLSSLAFKL